MDGASERIAGRRTRQKECVLKAVSASRDHPTAEAILHEVRRTLPRISLGTVYRILGSLAEAGHVRVLETGDGPRRYDADVRPHAHVVCRSCGAVADAPAPDLEACRVQVERATGFAITASRVAWEGLCPRCCSDPEITPEHQRKDQDHGM